MTPGTPTASRAERAAWTAALAAGALALAKLAAGWATGSLAIAASSLDSLMDLLASGANALAIRGSVREPTRTYAFGYGKLQALAGLLQGVFITASALGLALASAERFRHPRALEALGLGALVLVLSTVASAWIAAFLRREALRAQNPLLEADAMHYAADFGANGAALLALGMGWAGLWTGFDPLICIVLSAWVLRGALRVAGGAVGELLDHGLPEAEVAKVGEVVARYAPEARGFHDLRTRRSGHRRYFDFHVVIRPDMTFLEAHELTDRILRDLEALWPGADVTVHPDPEPDARLPYAGQG